MSSTNLAFDLLVEMAATSRQKAQGLPEQAQIHQTWKGISFELLEHQMISPMGQITEILPVPHFTHIPRVKNWVRGVANVRGRLVPVIDLPIFLGQQQIPNTKLRRLLVVELGDYIVGIIVNRVAGMQQLTLDLFNNDIPEDTNVSIKHFLSGRFTAPSGEILLFDMQKLLFSEAFVQVAATASE